MGREPSDEHRNRRRAAYLRSASAHERAAAAHTAAVRFFTEHGDADRADAHQQRAVAQLAAAVQDRDMAERQ